MRPDDLGDCERTRPTGLAQPSNAVSSLGFLPAAVWVWRVTRGGPDDRLGRALALTMLANGIGSFWYHGPYTEAGARLHDAAAIAYPGLVAATDAGDSRRLRATVIGATGVATLTALVDRRMTPVGAGGIVVLLVAVEAGRARKSERPPRRALAALLASAGIAYLLGRSDSPSCRPESRCQAHAAWHLLAAASGVAWLRARLVGKG